jgi:hypothetical protein
MRSLRNLAKRNFKRVFELGQRLGVDVLPRHFYSSIPDFRALRADDRWRTAYDMIGVAGAHLDEQEQALRNVMSRQTSELLRSQRVYEDACAENGEVGYGPADGDALFAFFRAHRPARVVQIGCGVTTAIIRRASDAVALTCVDPYPTQLLKRLSAEGKITLLPEKAEHFDAARLADLVAGDMLFVDSSHATRPGSDVHHVIFRVLPRLPAGVWIHFHDINFPYDFGPNILGPSDLFFGGESGLLHAYLIHNPRCRIAFSLSMLHHARPEVLKELLPHYTPVKTDRGINPRGWEGATPSATYLLTAE